MKNSSGLFGLKGGMPSVLQVAQQISQEENQQQNGPNLSNLLNSSCAAHSRNPALPQQVQPAGWDKNHVLVVPAPVPSQQQHTDWSLFDVIGMENQITCYEAQMLPKLKVTGKLIEDISCSPSPPRLEPVKLQPSRDLCVFPAVAVAPPCLYGANPSYPWTDGMQPLQFSLEEQRTIINIIRY